MSTHVMTGTEARDVESGERVRAVLASESEVCHKWVAQRQTHGRFRAVYFSGRVLYSYGSHYVIGRIEDGGEVLLNAERNSVTTNGHVRAASDATRHLTQFWIPDLTEALKLAGDVRRAAAIIATAKREGEDLANGESYAARYGVAGLKAAKTRGRAWLRDHASEFNDTIAAEYMTRLFGWPRSAWPAIKREAEAAERKAKAAAAKLAKARALEDAKRFADCSADEFPQYLPADSNDWNRTREPGALGYLAGSANGQYAQTEFAKQIGRAHKASKAAGYTTRTRTLWARLKIAREHAAGFARRERAAKLAKLQAEFNAAREAGTLASLLAWRFPESMQAEIAAAKAGEERERAAAAYQAWRETPTAVARPDSLRFDPDSLERRVLQQFERAEAEELCASFEAWREAGRLERLGRPFKLAPSKPKDSAFMPSGLVARYPDLMERLGGDPWRELLRGWTREEAERRVAAEAEAKRLREASEAERAEAWKAGAAIAGYHRLSDERGGALLRIEGEGEAAELVTSHGARVPLAEAVAAFRFVKLIRQRGEGWQRNGRRVRVGSYQLDSIQPSGDFVAGCHSINWPEIERVAILAGVFEAEPSDAAEHKPTHA